MPTKELELEVLPQEDTEPHTSNRIIVEKALSQMNFSAAAKQLLLDPETSNTDLDSLNSIAVTQEHLVQVKKSLGAIVDSMHENPSLISRAARFWGELPLWQRIIGGVAISGPTLIIGSAANIGFLVTISGVSALGYTTSGLVLDDHHLHSKSIAQKLKDGIFGVAEVLELTIGALNSIRIQLAAELNRFKEENNQLTQNITRMNEEVETLSTQVELYVETEKLLRKTKEKLETTASSLKLHLEKQGEQYEANQMELLKVQNEHSKSVFLLSQKTSELAEVRAFMGAEIEKAKNIALTLENTVKALSSAAISDSSQRQVFQEKLDIFLKDKTTSFDQVTTRLGDTERELSEVKTELQKSTEQFNQLLKLQEKQLHRLQGIDRDVDASIHPEEHLNKPEEQTKNAGLLGKLGLMSIPQLWPLASSSTAKPNPSQNSSS